MASAGWQVDNAEKRLALRVLRANNDWGAYGQNRYRKAV
jgi:hypothetical protein